MSLGTRHWDRLGNGGSRSPNQDSARRPEYADWRDAAETLTAGLDETGKARVFGGTASEFYRLGL